jgi:uncharacterized membrane protein
VSNPIDPGALIRRTFQIYVDQSPVLMPAAAVVFAITGVLSSLLIVASPGLAILAIVISLTATTLFTGMVVELVADVQSSRREVSVGQLLRAVTPVFGQLVAVGLLAGILEAVGFVLLLVPGLILLTIWSVAAPVVVLERPGAVAALRRSAELVRGNGWQVFAVIAVLVIGVVLLAGAIELAGESAGALVGLVVRVVVGILSAPISALAAAVLYFDLRAGSSTPPAAGSEP